MHAFHARTILILLFTLVAFAGCGQTAPDTTGRSPAGGASTGGADRWPVPLTILSMQLGDIACYVRLKDARGAEHDIKAAHELCDDLLIGKRVVVTTEKVRLQSPECEGDPECSLSVEEEIITGIDRVP